MPGLLCALYDLPRQTLYSRIKREGWINPRTTGTRILAGLREAAATEEHARKLLDEVTGDSRPEEHVRLRDGDLPPADPRTEQSEKALAVNKGHLTLAAEIRTKLQALLRKTKAAGGEDRASRVFLEITTALEKLQKIERMALEMDRGQNVAVPVIIMATPKAKVGEWAQAEAVEVFPDGEDPPALLNEQELKKGK